MMGDASILQEPPEDEGNDAADGKRKADEVLQILAAELPELWRFDRHIPAQQIKFEGSCLGCINQLVRLFWRSINRRLVL